MRPERTKKTGFNIVIVNVNIDLLKDLEKFFHRNHCDYVHIDEGRSYVSDQDLDEEWYLKNV